MKNISKVVTLNDAVKMVQTIEVDSCFSWIEARPVYKDTASLEFVSEFTVNVVKCNISRLSCGKWVYVERINLKGSLLLNTTIDEPADVIFKHRKGINAYFKSIETEEAAYEKSV